MLIPSLGGKHCWHNRGKSDMRSEGEGNVGAGHLYALGDDHYPGLSLPGYRRGPDVEAGGTGTRGIL